MIQIKAAVCKWRPENREKYNEIRRIYQGRRRAENPLSFRGCEARYDNSSKGRERSQRYRDAHKEQERQRSNKWYQENKEKALAARRKRIASEQQVNESFPVALDRFVRRFWNDSCGICGKPQTEERQRLCMDHWHPLSGGNPLTVKNAVLMCNMCNGHKAAKMPRNIFSPLVVQYIEECLEEQALLWNGHVKEED